MTDVLLVCLGSTAGLRAAEDELAGALRRAGASVAQVRARAPREVRTFALTDLGWAVAARRAALAGLAAHRPRAVVYSTTTAALLWPRPGAIRFDALAAATRPGRHGAWQRPLERRRLAQATVLVPQSEGAGEAVVLPGDRVVVPVPVAASGPLDGPRDIAAITYAANWRKKGLDRVLAAWGLTRAAADDVVAGGADAPGATAADALVAAGPEELVVAGADPADLAAAWRAGRTLAPELGAALPAGVRAAGRLDARAYRALLRRARVFATAPRREDYGIAQLEALADGCRLVTSAAPGPYAALPLARALAPELVVERGDDVTGLAAALGSALGAPRAAAPRRAAAREALLAPFSRAAADRAVADELLPRLLG